MPKLTSLLVLWVFFLHQGGFAQVRQPSAMEYFKINDSVMNHSHHNVLPPQYRMPAIQTRSNNQTGTPAKNHEAVKNKLPTQILPASIDRKTSAMCLDTSVRLVYSKDSLWFANDYLTKTRDGNILIPGFELNYFTNHIDAHLVKVTQQGDTLWSKSIQGGYPGFFIDVYKAFELADGSLLLAGDLDVPMPVNGRSDFMMLRVTSTGNLIWQKTFKTSLWGADTTNGSINIFDCKQDANGDMYIGGDVRYFGPPRQALAFKMDLAGNVVWSKGFELGDVPVITGVNIVNKNVTFFGNTIYGNVINCFAIVLDASSGDTLSYKYLVPSGGTFWRTFYEDNMVKLNNGNLVLFGRGVSDGVTFDTTQLPTHHGMIEVTPDFDFVRSYIFRSPVTDNSYNSRITVFEDGSAAFTRLYNNSNSGYSANVIFGDFQNGQILKERIIPYHVGISWVSNFIQLDDGGQVITTFFGDSAAQVSATEFMKLHNSDTSGSCLGKDTSATIIQPETFYSATPYFNNIYVDVLTENHRPFKGIFDNTFKIGTNCAQVSFCDSLKLHISQDTICANGSVSIAIKKNRECGATPLWTYDTTAVSSFYNLNDTTISATFNKPWQGFISASIQGCKTLEDSIHLTVLLAPSLLDIGPDTVICPGNTILLNAREGYASYKWQDGTTDSVFIVTVPGKYYVSTTDACGGSFSDTVTVLSHPPIPFDLGANIAICKNDTIAVSAPGGFIHYQWTSYNISNDTAQDVNISPSKSSWYKVIAEKTPGCFATDSLFVTVNSAPGIYLGNDTSFCANQFVTLDAGSGFSSYNWNTGSLNETITVTQPGAYTVKGGLNGCYSYDTLQVLNVYPLPLFSLGIDTALCQGHQLSFTFNLPQAAYLWNTGSTLNNFTVSGPGAYWLEITQNGCKYADTINIAYNPAPIVNLGQDTTLCEGVALRLDAFNINATYVWQDGSTATGYLVKQPGFYSVMVDLNHCVAADSIKITYKVLPYFSLGKDSFLCMGQSYILMPTINTNASFLWQDGSTFPNFTVLKEGVYSLTAYNECGAYTDSVVIISGACNIMMPSAFTPNGDGINDVFKVKFPFPVKQFHMLIYDRWGEKVFETNNISEGWNGRSKGLPALQNSYAWIIKFVDSNNRQQQLKGVVTLLR